MIEQVQPAAVQDWQEVAIQITLRFSRGLIADVMLHKPLARPLARVAVALDFDDLLAREQLRELRNHIFGRERRLALPERVDDHDILLAVADCQRH